LACKERLKREYIGSRLKHSTQHELEKGGQSLNKIGLRKEEKLFETRVPIVPDHVRLLREKYTIDFVLEPSNQRAFSENEYDIDRANIIPLKGSGVPIIMGIKEMPIDIFEKDIAYIFFSHTIKGQSKNMPMLKKILDVGATLIDYELVVDEKGRRLIYFGNWAGMAGISDTLRVLGERLELKGIKPNPFAEMKHTLKLKGLEELKEEFELLGTRIKEQGLPDELTPFVVGFAGYGNVSRGAQEIFDILPHKTVNPDELPKLVPESNLLYKCVFKEEHMVEPKDPSAKFDLQDYYMNGKSKYTGIFHRHIPYITVLMNCIYWTNKSPRLVTLDFIRTHWKKDNRKLQVIGDISCDIRGAIEFTIECTSADRPAFTYIINENQVKLGVEGEGPVVVAVDNLPCELPRESSTSFSKTLLDFIPTLANADFTVPFTDLELPREFKDAIIVYQGKLTEKFQYLEQYLPKEDIKE
jgi:saccharopine dehydrogenase (NAD+, L-lysine-forming)